MWTASEVGSNETPSINRRKYRIGFLTSNTSKLSSLSSMLTALQKSQIFIRFFCEGLKPSIKAQIEQRGRELDSWDELVEKAIDAEAKARLQPASILCEIDRLAHEIIAPLILPWPKPRHYWLENLETSPPPPSNRPRLEISLNLRTSRPP